MITRILSLLIGNRYVKRLKSGVQLITGVCVNWMCMGIDYLPSCSRVAGSRVRLVGDALNDIL